MEVISEDKTEKSNIFCTFAFKVQWFQNINSPSNLSEGIMTQCASSRTGLASSTMKKAGSLAVAGHWIIHTVSANPFSFSATSTQVNASRFPSLFLVQIPKVTLAAPLLPFIRSTSLKQDSIRPFLSILLSLPHADRLGDTKTGCSRYASNSW